MTPTHTDKYSLIICYQYLDAATEKYHFSNNYHYSFEDDIVCVWKIKLK